ncbi:MAG: hypothetical protein N2745_11295 [Syntrophorhabdaceae bacterium]|nr:hypothetical protein [Syntrophorhabdaceae bacterium]
MKKEENEIIFIHPNGYVLARYPMEGYEPGDIKEIRDFLAKSIKCNTEDIKVKITGMVGHRPKKGSSLNIKLLDSKAIRDFFE